jgi:hypothetical protein
MMVNEYELVMVFTVSPVESINDLGRYYPPMVVDSKTYSRIAHSSFANSGEALLFVKS